MCCCCESFTIIYRCALRGRNWWMSTHNSRRSPCDRNASKRSPSIGTSEDSAVGPTHKHKSRRPFYKPKQENTAHVVDCHLRPAARPIVVVFFVLFIDLTTLSHFLRGIGCWCRRRQPHLRQSPKQETCSSLRHGPASAEKSAKHTLIHLSSATLLKKIRTGTNNLF